MRKMRAIGSLSSLSCCYPMGCTTLPRAMCLLLSLRTTTRMVTICSGPTLVCNGQMAFPFLLQMIRAEIAEVGTVESFVVGQGTGIRKAKGLGDLAKTTLFQFTVVWR